jgi:hypothetical protein
MLYFKTYRDADAEKRMVRLSEACGGTGRSVADKVEEHVNMSAHRAILCADTRRSHMICGYSRCVDR